MITLKYMNNVKRQTVGEINIPQDLSQEEIVTYLLALYQNAGYEGAIESQKLYVVSADKGLIPLSSVDNIEKDAVIVYSAVIALNNAYRYGEYDGIKYFFHTGEKGHLNFPHIHAKEFGEKTDFSIYLKNLEIVGTPKNSKIKNKAIKYVRKNQVAIGKAWNKIIEAQGGPKWEP